MQILRLVATIAIGGSLVTGCATAADLRAKGPSETFYVAKTPEEYRDCAFNHSPGTFSVSPYRNGWMISRNNVGPNVQFLEIMPEGEGTRVSSYGFHGSSKDFCV